VYGRFCPNTVAAIRKAVRFSYGAGRSAMNNKKVHYAVAASIITAAALTACGMIICKKLFEKKYFTVNN